MKDSVHMLINILKNKNAPWADRHDAALDLSDFQDDDVVRALLEVAQNPSEDDTLLATCGESLGLVWVGRGKFEVSDFFSLSTAARDEVFSVIESNKPEWIEQYQLKNLE